MIIVNKNDKEISLFSLLILSFNSKSNMPDKNKIILWWDTKLKYIKAKPIKEVINKNITLVLGCQVLIFSSAMIIGKDKYKKIS